MSHNHVQSLFAISVYENGENVLANLPINSNPKSYPDNFFPQPPAKRIACFIQVAPRPRLQSALHRRAERQDPLGLGRPQSQGEGSKLSCKYRKSRPSLRPGNKDKAMVEPRQSAKIMNNNHFAHNYPCTCIFLQFRLFTFDIDGHHFRVSSNRI